MSEEKIGNIKIPSMNEQRKRWLIRLGTLFLISGLFFIFYWLGNSYFYETTEDAYVAGNQIQVMSQISGHVTQIFADETNFVKKGQPLVTLNKADVYIALKNAESQLALTTRQVAQQYQNVEQLHANYVMQELNLSKAQEDLRRRQGLVINKAISREDIQHAKLAVNSANAAVSLAKNQLDAGIDMVANSDLYHHPQVLQAENNFRNAYLNWQRTTINAPETGFIAKRMVQVGQHIDMNSVLMVLVPLNQVWVVANYKESQLSNIRIGQSANVIADAYGNDVKFKGTVVGLNPGAGNSFDLLPPQNATGNWIKIVQRLPVRIAIDAKQLAEHPLRIGLSMTVKVNTHNRARSELVRSKNDSNIYQTTDDISLLKQADQLINTILLANAKNTNCISCKL